MPVTGRIVRPLKLSCDMLVHIQSLHANGLKSMSVTAPTFEKLAPLGNLSAAKAEREHGSPMQPEVERKFRRLASEWKLRRSHAACVEEAIVHSAYLRIIGMGLQAIPLIMAELERQ